jgi:hypothetical protein
VTPHDPPAPFEKCIDQSVCFTLSLYITRQAVRDCLSTLPRGDQLRAFQREFHDSLKLRNAIDPLFNDIADRERLGHVDDILLDVDGPSQGEVIEMMLPDTVSWVTEGARFNASPEGLGRARPIRLRRFWYAHRDGALSYHLSFGVTYDHSPADFYFLSLLQKLAAPKEFTAAPLPPGKTAWRPTDPETGVFPLDRIHVTDATTEPETFWAFVSRRFDADAQDLFSGLAAHLKTPKFKPHSARFDKLVDHIPFIEVPDLEMPRARFMFFFQDKTLFQRLLPPLDPDTGRRPARSKLVQSQCYAVYPAQIQQRIETASDPTHPEVDLDDAYWTWVLNRYSDMPDAQVREVKATVPAFEPGRADCLHYLFTAGFNQNIIDFMNQDASEVQDSIDPIYPTNRMQEDESFFVRFANPRAIITYVESSRSLEMGNDFIGTCPYAFLIHVVALHNEFLARDYEAQTFRLIEEVESLTARRKFHTAAGRFYAFRTEIEAVYQRDRYVGIFRYDTEKDVFDSVERTRGTTRRDAYLDLLVSSAESQTRDLEARIAKKDEGAISALLGALGVFGFFQLIFNWSDAAQTFYDKGKSSFMTVSLRWPFLEFDPTVVETNAERLAAIGIAGSVVFLAVLLVAVVWIVFRRLRRLVRARLGIPPRH